MFLFFFNQDEGDWVILEDKLAFVGIDLSKQFFDGEDVILTLVALDLQLYWPLAEASCDLVFSALGADPLEAEDYPESLDKYLTLESGCSQAYLFIGT